MAKKKVAKKKTAKKAAKKTARKTVKKAAKKTAKKAARSSKPKSSSRSRKEDVAVAAAASSADAQSEVDEFNMSRFSGGEYSPEFSAGSGDSYSAYGEEEKKVSRFGLIAAVVAVVVILGAIYYVFFPSSGEQASNASMIESVDSIAPPAAEAPAPAPEAAKPEEAAPAAAPEAAAEAKPEEAAPAAAPAGGKTYKVKVGDQLFRIATRELGDGKRYKEILELNKDQLPKGAMSLQPGMVLKMPAK